MINEYGNPLGDEMNEVFFAVIQKADPWFCPTWGEKLPVLTKICR